MLHPLDDHLIHQAPLPLLQYESGDPNAYDRYFFHGYDETGMIFVVAMGIYPNRSIIDAAFCVSRDGHQRSVFASGRVSRDRASRIGPIEVEIVEPMREIAIRVDAPEQGLSAAATFHARSAAMEEPRHTLMDRNRVILDAHRYTQFGRWSGTVTTGDVTIDLDPATTGGTRDHSWGIRPLAGGNPQAPGDGGGIYWVWAPLQVADRCVLGAFQEDAQGFRKLQYGALLDDVGDLDPWDAESTIVHARDVDIDVAWESGYRRAEHATVTLRHVGDRPDSVVEVEPVGRIYMRGVGYTSLDRPHGAWHDELSVVGEELTHADIDPTTDFTCLHVQQVVKVSGTEGDGLGVMEQLPIGPHAPSGLTGFLDPPT